VTPNLQFQPHPIFDGSLTLPGCGLFLRVGEVGLSSAVVTKDPSKSLWYNVVKRSLEFLEGGRGNTFTDAKCFSRIALADFALSCASLTTCVLSKSAFSGPGGVSRALAERTRLAGRLDCSPLIFESFCLILVRLL